jgi:hypothetical protein
MRKFFQERLTRFTILSRFCLSLALLCLIAACASTPAPGATAPLHPNLNSTAAAPTSIPPSPTNRATLIATPSSRVDAPTLAPGKVEGTEAPDQPTLAPDPGKGTVTPAPSKNDSKTGAATVSESTVTLNVYPYDQFLRETRDPDTNIPFQAFDRAAYDAAPRRAESKTLRVLIVENEYLQLEFLPELGGRLYQVLYKPTGQSLFYNNPVLKPSPWGMETQQGWLAAGGMEWAFPTQEHGYEWGAPWDARISSNPDGVSVTLSDSFANDRPRVQVRVTLPAHASYFTIEPRIENPTTGAKRIQFWLNAMLNPGGNGRVSPEMEFILPSDAVLVHSTADDWVPPDAVPRAGARSPNAPVSFSNLNGRDLRFYRAWDKYLGVFAVDTGKGKLAQNFVGAYNHEKDFGVVRVFPPVQAPGVKLFGFGPNFCCRDAYTDDDSSYFELWGGIPRTFFPDDDITLAPGETRTWTEHWMPLAQMNGLSAASADAALSLQVRDGRAHISAYSAVAREVFVVLKENGVITQVRQIKLRPAEVWSEQIPIANPRVQVQLQGLNHAVIVETR